MLSPSQSIMLPVPTAQTGDALCLSRLFVNTVQPLNANGGNLKRDTAITFIEVSNFTVCPICYSGTAIMIYISQRFLYPDAIAWLAERALKPDITSVFAILSPRPQRAVITFSHFHCRLAFPVVGPPRLRLNAVEDGSHLSALKIMPRDFIQPPRCAAFWRCSGDPHECSARFPVDHRFRQ